MKKCICIIAVIFIFISCGNDNEDSSDIVFKGEAVEKIESGSFNQGGYYFNGNYKIYLPYIGENAPTDLTLWACDAICPNNHNEISYLKMTIESSLDYRCTTCNAQFFHKTGEPKNKEANGHKVAIYRYKYNSVKDEYTVWK